MRSQKLYKWDMVTHHNIHRNSYRVCRRFGQAILGQTWLWWFSLRLEPFFDTTSTASKIMLTSKVVNSDS